MTIVYEKVLSAPPDELFELYASAGWWSRGEPYEKAVLDIVMGSFCFFVAKDTATGKIVGMGRVISDGCSDGYIQDVTVLPSYRGQGIGREIMRHLVLFCQEKGLEWIGLVAEPGTTPFYKSLDFEVLQDYQPMLLKKKS